MSSGPLPDGGRSQQNDVGLGDIGDVGQLGDVGDLAFVGDGQRPRSDFAALHDPSAFSFADQTEVPLGAPIESNTVTLMGGSGAASWTATCGAGCTAISINGGAFVAGPSSGVKSGDTIKIRQTSSSDYGMATTATVTVGGTTSSAWRVMTQESVTYLLTSQTNLNLQTYLSGKGAPTDRAIVLQLPSGVTIGSSSAGSAAITSGDLSGYQKVTLDVTGEVQGAGGTANGGVGGNAIDVASAMHITIRTSGAVRGGGGGGGRGGTGGSCDNVSWTSVPAASKTYWKNFGSYSPTGISLILESDVEQWRSPMDRNLLFTFQAGKYWKRGLSMSGVNSGSSDAWFDYYRATSLDNGAGGSGGSGGRGQGYGQSAAGGSAGAPGPYSRCGKGGTGGLGGSWGSKGATGAAGAAGYKHSTYNVDAPQSGGGGAGGGAAGAAISCSAAGIHYSKGGTVIGAVNCSLL